MNNNLQKLLEVIEPKIHDIEENRIETSSLKKVNETMQELVEYGDNYNGILDFYDQEFIMKAIKIGNSNSDELIDRYNVAKYLLKNKSQDLQDMPQFRESIDFMNQLYQYLDGLNEKIKIDYESKLQRLKIQELLNKYYNILNKENIFIRDIDEFLTFLDANNLDINTRLDILIYLNKCNIKNYITTNDIKINNNINLSNITNLLDKNKELINKKCNIENDNYNLDDYLKDNLNNIENAIEDRKAYLINKINNLYEFKLYSDTSPYYNEFMKLSNIEKEINKQKNSTRKLYFLFKNDKSLVRDYLDKTNIKYQSCIRKNLIDLETINALYLPKLCYNDICIYLKDDFVVKTIFTFIDDYILVLGILDKGEMLEAFLKKNEYLLENIINNKDKINKNMNERDLILKDIKLEDLVLSIDLDTLDIDMEDKNGR